MRIPTSIRHLAGATACALLTATAAWAQPSIEPLRTQPTETFVVNPGFRDWGPATIAGTTILAGNVTGRGGLFAVDTESGKVRWSFIPKLASGTASISTPPAVEGDTVITPFSAAYPGAVVAVHLKTGKELWRAGDPVVDGGVGVKNGLAYFLSKDGVFRAVDVASGKERWTATFTTSLAVCPSVPVVLDGTVYFSASAAATVGDKTKPAGYYLLALDAATGAERWRYRAEAPYVHNGVCLNQPVFSEGTIYASGDTYLYAVNRATGKDAWKPIEVRRPVEGRERAVKVFGLVDAGKFLVGMTEGFLIAFDKESGRTLWQVAGKYREASPCTAVAGDVLYFQGSTEKKPDAAMNTLHALDLTTREILWSFTRKGGDPNWSFGYVTPSPGGVWVDSYQALIKLQ